MQLIDTHTHIFLEDFNDDIDDVISRCLDNNITHCFLPNIDSSTILPLKNTCIKFPNNCMPLMGLHPCSVKDNYKEELKKIEEELFSSKYFGVGEAGIDLYWDKSFFKEQINALKIQIEWAKDLKLPIILHSRDSFQELINVIEECQDGRLNGIFHCFTGNSDDAKRVRDVGFYMGIGGVVTFKNGGLDKSLQSIPLDRFVLETDAPYLTPAPHRGKRNEPSFTLIVAKKMAEVYECSIEQIAEHTTQNAKLIFNF